MNTIDMKQLIRYNTDMSKAQRIANKLERQRKARIQATIRKWTAFESLEDMVSGTWRSYRPSLRCSGHRGAKGSAKTITELADAYDAAQEAKGDARRAFRT